MRAIDNPFLAEAMRRLSPSPTVMRLLSEIMDKKMLADIEARSYSVEYVADADYREVKKWCDSNGFGSVMLSGVYLAPLSAKTFEESFQLDSPFRRLNSSNP